METGGDMLDKLKEKFMYSTKEEIERKWNSGDEWDNVKTIHSMSLAEFVRLEREDYLKRTRGLRENLRFIEVGRETEYDFANRCVRYKDTHDRRTQGKIDRIHKSLERHRNLTTLRIEKFKRCRGFT